MSTVLIIGASRGIGFELARQYREAGVRVIATARRDEHLLLLTAIGCEVMKLDVTSLVECSTLAWKLDGEEIDVAILNAGIYGRRTEALDPPAAPDFDAVMQTNVLAAMRVLPSIAPMVAAANGTLAVMSSRMGSIAGREASYGCLYRVSKAALNSVLADVAHTYGPQGATCVALHPGWVRTEMGGSDATLEVHDVVAGLRKTLAELPRSEWARFVSYDGSELSW